MIGKAIFLFYGAKTRSSPLASVSPDHVRDSQSDVDLKNLRGIVNLEKYALDNDAKFESLVQKSRKELRKNSAVTMPNFLTRSTVKALVEETLNIQHKAYYRKDNSHNVYVTPLDESKPPTHIYNRQVITSKGCVTTDQLHQKSLLKTIYHNERFQKFLEQVLNSGKIHVYSPRELLSSVTVHYNSKGQELGWHFDNSAFAVTLLLQKPEGGGVFEFVPHIRNKDAKTNDEEVTMGFETVEGVVDGKISPKKLELDTGTLVLFNGRNSLHRVTEVTGDTTRILVVFAYNEKPDMELPDSAKMIFFGRTGKEEKK